MGVLSGVLLFWHWRFLYYVLLRRSHAATLWLFLVLLEPEKALLCMHLTSRCTNTYRQTTPRIIMALSIAQHGRGAALRTRKTGKTVSFTRTMMPCHLEPGDSRVLS